MSAAVDDVHHRDGENIGVGAAKIAVKGKAKFCRCSLCDCEGYAKDSVCAPF